MIGLKINFGIDQADLIEELLKQMGEAGKIYGYQIEFSENDNVLFQIVFTCAYDIYEFGWETGNLVKRLWKK